MIKFTNVLSNQGLVVIFAGLMSTHIRAINILIIKISISSIVIGLKTAIFHLFTCQVVIGHFNEPITFKVVVT